MLLWTNTAIIFQLGLFANPIYSSEGDYPQIIHEELEKLSIAQGYPKSRLRKFTPEEVTNIKGEKYTHFNRNCFISLTYNLV
jgi:lactase-phlorizin hydrolase